MAYIHVRLLNGFPQPLTYSVPASISDNLQGTIVKVPLKHMLVSAYVVAHVNELKVKPAFEIKPMHSVEIFPQDTHYKNFIKQLAAYYQVDPIHLVKRMRHFVNQEADDQLNLSSVNSPVSESVILTAEQQVIVDALSPEIGAGKYTPALIHGVTGSGKTEIYKKLIIKNFEQHQTTILLLPEVSLALRFEQLLKTQLPEYPIFGFHSGTRPKEKKILWQYLLEHKPMLIVGVHIPILLPVHNLGLIIIDEEHETGYQEKKHPKINSKEAALLRASLYKIPIVLGSATPSISSLHIAKKKNWYFFSLQYRYAGAFPEVKVVLLANKDRRPQFWITKELQAAIADRLAKKEQIIIFLNRRGFSFFVQCKNCSFVFTCNNCSVSLTLHGADQLNCHYCSHTQALPIKCTSCSSAQLLKKGIGTQQVVTILEQLFPGARVGRADMDVSSKKKVWKQTMDDFDAGAIDILVGTQTITKGFHFPKVTLVGILWADLNLHFPVYNAAETTLQQLIQVAGRAGRSQAGAQVIVQAMMHHPIFNYLNEVDYLKFYESELSSRNAIGYPPCIRLAEIELKHSDEQILEQEAMQLAMHLMNTISTHKTDVRLLGPAKPPVSKIKNTHARKIYVKSESVAAIIELYKKIDHKKYNSSIFFTPNPQ